MNTNALEVYEMGSVCKGFPIAIALDTGKATLTDIYIYIMMLAVLK